MTSLIDVNELKRKARVRFFLHVFGIVLLTLAVIGVSISLLLLSNLEYTLNLVINIVLDSLCFCFLVFYFFNIFPVVKHYYKVFGKMNQVAFEHRRRLEFVEEKNNRYIDNVRFRTLNFIYQEGENEFSESLYVLDNDTQFEAHKFYSLFTYQNIIVKFEEVNDATIQ